MELTNLVQAQQLLPPAKGVAVGATLIGCVSERIDDIERQEVTDLKPIPGELQIISLLQETLTVEP